jgi:hypothetical protein
MGAAGSPVTGSVPKAPTHAFQSSRRAGSPDLEVTRSEEGTG